MRWTDRVNAAPEGNGAVDGICGARHAQAPQEGEALVPDRPSSATERAQRAATAEFWQVGPEALGSDDPAVDDGKRKPISRAVALMAERT